MKMPVTFIVLCVVFGGVSVLRAWMLERQKRAEESRRGFEVVRKGADDGEVA